MLKRIINFGFNKNLCDRLRFKIEVPRVDNIKTEDLTPEQIQQLLRAIEEDGNIHGANMMKMALFTGMRRGEMFKLKWDHVNIQHCFIHIVDPKGGSSQKIPLNSQAKILLETHHRTESPYVFPGKDGKQRTTISKTVNRIKQRTGLPKDFRPLHGLRHVYASMLTSSGKVDMYNPSKAFNA